MRIETDLFLRIVCGGDRTAGGVELSPDALDAILEIAGKIENPKRDKKDLTGEKLAKYIAAAKIAIEAAQKEFDAGGRLMSRRQFAKAIDLDESTVRRNVTLNSIYDRFKKDNCRVMPSTVDNDPDNYYSDLD